MNYKLSDILRAQELLQDLNVEFADDKEKLQSLFKKFSCKSIEELKTLLDSERKISHQYLLKTINNYPWSNYFENDDMYLVQRSIWTNQYMIEKISSFISQYTDWKLPVAYVEPNTGDLSRHIISGDPFYVIDDWKLPYQQIVESFPKESRNKFLKYTKLEADQFLEPESVGLTISYKNIPFKKLGAVEKEIKLMAKITRPGGYVMFDYVDANSVVGAEFIEDKSCEFQWKERIYRFLQENNLEVVEDFNGKDHYGIGYSTGFNFCVCKKAGSKKSLNLTNKLGLVLPNRDILDQKRKTESEENKRLRAARSKIKQDLKVLQERDVLLRDLDQKRAAGKENVIESKLQNAINHLNSMISAYDDYTHPSVLEGILHVSKLTYSLGRVKDSKNLIKRVARDIDKMSADNFIARKYREWQDFLNNIDT